MGVKIFSLLARVLLLYPVSADPGTSLLTTRDHDIPSVDSPASRVDGNLRLDLVHILQTDFPSNRPCLARVRPTGLDILAAQGRLHYLDLACIYQLLGEFDLGCVRPDDLDQLAGVRAVGRYQNSFRSIVVSRQCWKQREERDSARRLKVRSRGYLVRQRARRVILR